MMKILLFVALQIVWSYGSSDSNGINGGGAFAYSDSQGNRYGGTYGLKDGKVVSKTGNLPQNFPEQFPVPTVRFSEPFGFGYGFYGDGGIPDFGFGSDYFPNIGNSLQEVFDNVENQRLAYLEAQNAFGLTQPAGYYPNFPRFPAFGNFERFGYQPPNFNFAMPGYNSAAAGAAIGPGYRHQYASIYPTNSGMPNVNEFINRMSDTASGPNQYSVSSSSYASSSNINGKETSQRGGETIVNDNGKITKYKVNN